MQKNYTRQLSSEYQKLLKRFLKFRKRSEFKRSRLLRIQYRLKAIYDLLLPKLGMKKLASMAGAGAMVLGMLSPSQIDAQTFSSPTTNPFGLLPSTSARTSYPNFVDLDNDGDLDILASVFYEGFYYYENVGNAEQPDFATAELNPFGLQHSYAHPDPSPVLVDIDNDGDQDLILSEHDSVIFIENTGTASAPQFAEGIDNTFGITVPSYYNYYNLEAVDLDNDGDFDIMAADSDNFVYFENVGTAEQASFADAVETPFNLLGYTYYDTKAIVDLDNDGDFDMLSFVYDGSFDGSFRYFENTGNSETPDFSNVTREPFGIAAQGLAPRAFIEMADLDNDGDIDLLFSEYAVGNSYDNQFFFTYYENISGLTSTADLPEGLEIDVFPTLTSNVVNIRSSHDLEVIELLDATGKLVLTENNATSQLSLRGLTAGIYYVKLNIEDGGFVTKRVIKQ
jgi:hypothetical protein